MFVPFLCVAIAALLPYLWSYVVLSQRVRQFGGFDNKLPRPEQARLEGLGARAVGAASNAFETFPMFATAVLAATIVQLSPERVSLLSVVYVVARFFHGLLYLMDLDKLRTLVFMIGFLALMALYGLVLVALA